MAARAAALRSSAYGRLLGSPGVRWQVAGGLLAQVTQGATAVGIILLVREHGGSLALGGAVTGGLSVAAGIARPLQGRVIDRRGSTVVMGACGLVHALALAGIVLAEQLGGAGWGLVALGVSAGLALPPVSSSMRAQFGRLLPAQDRTAAYSLVYLTQEIAILTGPLLLSAMIAVDSAALGLLVIAGLTAIGSLMFAATAARSTEGPAAPASPTSRVPLPLRIPALRLLLALALLLGGVLGALLVAAPALATAHRAPASAGLLIACMSIGGIAGAIAYGSRRWAAPPSIRLRVLLIALALTLGPLIAVNSLVVAGALLLVMGLSLNPALTTFSLLVDRCVPVSATTEAFGWLSTALAGGTGAGSVIAAALAGGHDDYRPAFIVAVTAGTCAVLLSAWVSAGPERAP